MGNITHGYLQPCPDILVHMGTKKSRQLCAERHRARKRPAVIGPRSGHAALPRRPRSTAGRTPSTRTASRLILIATCPSRPEQQQRAAAAACWNSRALFRNEARGPQPAITCTHRTPAPGKTKREADHGNPWRWRRVTPNSLSKLKVAKYLHGATKVLGQRHTSGSISEQCTWHGKRTIKRQEQHAPHGAATVPGSEA